jgi:hypothetical protein
MNDRKTSGVALAAAAALMFSAISITTQAEEAKVKCEGVTSCKGQGYLDLTKAQCRRNLPWGLASTQQGLGGRNGLCVG